MDEGREVRLNERCSPMDELADEDDSTYVGMDERRQCSSEEAAVCVRF